MHTIFWCFTFPFPQLISPLTKYWWSFSTSYKSYTYFYLFIMDIYVIKLLSRYWCFHQFYYPKNKKNNKEAFDKTKTKSSQQFGYSFCEFFLKIFFVGWLVSFIKLCIYRSCFFKATLLNLMSYNNSFNSQPSVCL